MSRRRRHRLLLVGIALLALSNVAAICFGSGAHKIFTHADGFIILDSTGALFGTLDDGETWEPTRSLPRERTKYADEVCVPSGCYRISADRLGIERESEMGWDTVWAYDAGRVSYLQRQLDGPCGDGHANLGLIGMAPTYEGSRWEFVAAAGADGVLGLSNDGRWVTDIYTEPAFEGAGLSETYLVPEMLAIAIAIAAVAIVFAMHDGSEVATAITAVFLGVAAASGVWTYAQGSMTRSLLLLALLAGIPLLGLAGWCLGHYCDLAEMLVGVFLGAGIAVGGAAVEMSHGDFTFGIVMACISLIVLVAGAAAARDQVGAWSMSLRRWLAVLGALVIGGFAAFAAYAAWVWGWIGPRWVADALAIGVGIAALLSARRIWQSRRSFDVPRQSVDV